MSLKLDLSKLRTQPSQLPALPETTRGSTRRSIIDDYSNRNRDSTRFNLNSHLYSDRSLHSPRTTRHLSLSANILEDKTHLLKLQRHLSTPAYSEKENDLVSSPRLAISKSPRPKSPSPAERMRHDASVSPETRVDFQRRATVKTERHKSLVHRHAAELYEDVRTESPRREETDIETERARMMTVANRRDQIAAIRNYNQFNVRFKPVLFGSVPRDVAKPNPIEKLFDVSYKDLHIIKLKSPRDILPPEFNSRDMTFYRIGRLPPPTRAAYGSIPRHIINSDALDQYDHMKVNKKKAQMDLLRRTREQEELDKLRRNRKNEMSMSDIMILRTQGYFFMSSSEIAGVENYMYQTECRFSPKCIYDGFIQDKKIAEHWHKQEDYELLFDSANVTMKV